MKWRLTCSTCGYELYTESRLPIRDKRCPNDDALLKPVPAPPFRPMTAMLDAAIDLLLSAECELLAAAGWISDTPKRDTWSSPDGGRRNWPRVAAVQLVRAEHRGLPLPPPDFLHEPDDPLGESALTRSACMRLHDAVSTTPVGGRVTLRQEDASAILTAIVVREISPPHFLHAERVEERVAVTRLLLDVDHAARHLAEDAVEETPACDACGEPRRDGDGNPIARQVTVGPEDFDRLCAALDALDSDEGHDASTYERLRQRLGISKVQAERHAPSRAADDDATALLRAICAAYGNPGATENAVANAIDWLRITGKLTSNHDTQVAPFDPSPPDHDPPPAVLAAFRNALHDDLPTVVPPTPAPEDGKP